MTYAVKAVSELLQKGLPIFGICLGHQILSLALGGKTSKLKFGHRGANQPVKDLDTGRVEITSQNHGFTVDGAPSTVNPWFCEVISTRPVSRSLTGWLAPR